MDDFHGSRARRARAACVHGRRHQPVDLRVAGLMLGGCLADVAPLVGETWQLGAGSPVAPVGSPGLVGAMQLVGGSARLPAQGLPSPSRR